MTQGEQDEKLTFDFAGKDRSAEHDVAVAALRKLTGNWRPRLDRQRAFAASHWKEERDRFIDSLGGRCRASTPACLGRLLGGRRCPNRHSFCIGTCLPRGCDHTDLILRDGKPYAIVTQPYGLDHDRIRGMIDWAEKHGLVMTADARGSWHFPSQTMLVVFRTRATVAADYRAWADARNASGGNAIARGAE